MSNLLKGIHLPRLDLEWRKHGIFRRILTKADTVKVLAMLRNLFELLLISKKLILQLCVFISK